MDTRHEEFMAMADAFLGPQFDRVKLAQVEKLQVDLHEGQARLATELDSHRIERSLYVDEVSKLHADIAQRCETILGRSNFQKLFGILLAEAGTCIDMEVFLAKA